MILALHTCLYVCVFTYLLCTFRHCVLCGPWKYIFVVYACNIILAHVCSCFYVLALFVYLVFFVLGTHRIEIDSRWCFPLSHSKTCRYVGFDLLDCAVFFGFECWQWLCASFVVCGRDLVVCVARHTQYLLHSHKLEVALPRFLTKLRETSSSLLCFSGQSRAPYLF